MCYSGRCRWEGYMGDCAFPKNKKVREKYPYPVCDIPENKTEQEYLDEVYKDIQEILRQENENDNQTIN